MHLVSGGAMGGNLTKARILSLQLLEGFQLYWGEASLWCSSLGLSTVL